MRPAPSPDGEGGASQGLGGEREGLVVAAHGRHVVVLDERGHRIRCHSRGRRSEAVVGDRVWWRPTGDEGVLERLQDRRNLLFRQDEWRTKSFAANLDSLLLLVAADPPFSESQLSRALIAAAAAGIDVWIGLNKTDLPAATAARERLAPYRAMGVDVLEMSLRAAPQAAVEHLQRRLQGKTTLVLGPSGMGKSTLINHLVPQAEATVGEISRALNSGRHTTTTTTWYPLGQGPADGALIDSPGFQEVGLHHIAAQDLATLMPDLAAHLGHCRFYNCTHRHEPGCGVREAAQTPSLPAAPPTGPAAPAPLISPGRWRIYRELFEELSAPRADGRPAGSVLG
jgi:ribosome biogenesis GTPase